MAEQRQGSIQAGRGRGGRKFPEMKNKELKQRAVEFYAKHKVTDALEKLLNQLFIAAPSDVYGYMVRARVYHNQGWEVTQTARGLSNILIPR